MIKKIINRLRLFYYRINYRFFIRNAKSPTVLSTEDTLNIILENKLSFARFGDGEFYLMLGLDYSPFQKLSKALQDDLLMVFSSENKQILVGIPETIKDCSMYLPKPRKFWEEFWGGITRRLLVTFLAIIGS